MFQVSFKGVYKKVLRKFKWCFKDRGCFKKVSGKFQGSFKKVSRVFQVRLKGLSSNLKGFKYI